MRTIARIEPRVLQREVTNFLTKHRFTHFVTLTTHDPMLSNEGMRSRLKQWDARVNRQLVGPKWSRHKDEVTFFFAFLESPHVNPHWHLLLRLDDSPLTSKPTDILTLSTCFTSAWKRLSPAGTVDLQEIYSVADKKLVNYVGKQLGSMAQYSAFVTPDEFRP
ncbi:MAG: hypothetical protein CML29_13220 [Rhizobiales bacterium]|nr:hypothetical protein [Hyphomicrobiales bacterium]MBA69486.1 hypothetical protein [Hyphomicrobiales bacterium]|tara:strand:+ start:628 stop:1116 length:489 start_codon:yes stop_codon:yes gene_type:complete